jgi:hypothetical protein
MTAPLTRGARVVAKHPLKRGAWWGTIVSVYGERVGVIFDLDMRHPKEGKDMTTARVYWLPDAIVRAPVMPAAYLDDGVGEYYWRKDQELEAERLAFHHDPANQGKVHWPETYID